MIYELFCDQTHNGLAKVGGDDRVKLSLVIPAYNESAIIRDTLETVSRAVSALIGDYEILVVDDGSTDDMARRVQELEDPHIRLEGYQPNHGKGCAVRTGMLAAQGDIILCTDADLAYGTEVFAAFLDRFSHSEIQLVIGSRRLSPDGYRDYPPLRLLTSRAFNLLVRLLSGLRYDTQCGIKAYRREAAQRIFSRCTADGFSFDFEVLMLADAMGLKVDQLPVSIVNHRESKINILRDSARMFRDIFRIRRRVRGLRGTL